MVITVTCPACTSAFPVDPDKIPEGGVNARCTQCNNVFRVEKPAAEAPSLPEPSPVPTMPDPVAVEPPPLPEPPAPEPPPAPVVDDLPTFGEPVLEELPPTPEPPAEETPTWLEPIGAEEGVVEEPSAPPPLPEPVLPDPTPSVGQAASDPFAQPAPFEGAGPAEPAGLDAPRAPGPDPTPVEAPAAEERSVTEPPAGGFTFGKRDPTDKAKRLARVLVSDMIMYNAERHQTALAAGTLAQDFEDEIDKSWKEYVEQVGEELASGQGRTFWVDALNDILAKGQEVF